MVILWLTTRPLSQFHFSSDYLSTHAMVFDMTSNMDKANVLIVEGGATTADPTF
jgi:hypothetical protein